MSDINEYANDLMRDASEHDREYNYCLPIRGQDLFQEITAGKWFTPVWRFHYDEELDSIAIIQGENGMILTKQQLDIDWFISCLLNFYDAYSDTDICYSNYQNFLQNENIVKYKNNGSQAVQERERTTYVYLMYSSSGHYKIGISDNPKNRLKQLTKTIGPFDLSLIRCVPAQEAKEVESYLHDYFSNYHIRGEWFVLDEECLDIIHEEFNILEAEFNE